MRHLVRTGSRMGANLVYLPAARSASMRRRVFASCCFCSSLSAMRSAAEHMASASCTRPTLCSSRASSATGASVRGESFPHRSSAIASDWRSFASASACIPSSTSRAAALRSTPARTSRSGSRPATWFSSAMSRRRSTSSKPSDAAAIDLSCKCVSARSTSARIVTLLFGPAVWSSVSVARSSRGSASLNRPSLLYSSAKLTSEVATGAEPEPKCAAFSSAVFNSRSAPSMSSLRKHSCAAWMFPRQLVRIL
mmetsp:Transcript_7315/g.15989  ORF Transcript_7315/g.15989 Transcript_7315/m.15989 type:complete len:252 (-) Transcript_7315:548-1303(-)